MKRTIMIIDDDKELLGELSEALMSHGYMVRTFSDGKTALQAAARIMPDLILLDLKMDKVSGFQVADKLNCSPQTEHIPIIAMTGYFTQKEYSLITRICGIKTCINKPFTMEAIVSQIEKIVSPVVTPEEILAGGQSNDEDDDTHETIEKEQR